MVLLIVSLFIIGIVLGIVYILKSSKKQDEHTTLVNKEKLYDVGKERQRGI